MSAPTPPPAPERPRRRLSRREIVFVATIAGLLLAAVVLALWLDRFTVQSIYALP